MRQMKIRTMASVLCIIILMIFTMPAFKIDVGASEIGDDTMVVVSLGDSYSSGEGIPDFYGQEKGIPGKYTDNNWLAHRSTKSWSSLLFIPGSNPNDNDKLSNYNVDYYHSSKCEWYFRASSGAETKHISKEPQDKPLNVKGYPKHTPQLPLQIDVFKEVHSPVDYVTLTLGGNDIDFVGVVTHAALGSLFLGDYSLAKSLDKKIDELPKTMQDLKDVYTDIHEAAPQAKIIVAGYPKLFEKNGKGLPINKLEAEMINSSVSLFNSKIRLAVTELETSLEGMKDCIYFVDVESEFDKDDGHQAYSKEPWINAIKPLARSEDLNKNALASSYSMHPNEKGARAYARCVNAKIKEIEDKKKANEKVGTISGKVCKASDRTSPVVDATVNIYLGDTLYNSYGVNESGNYNIDVPIGDYKIEITAEGYIPFIAYTKVQENDINYLETFLLVSGTEGESGTAKGNVIDALTGQGVPGVDLTVRKGWNNIGIGEIVHVISTDDNGQYSMDLPIGNYTVTAEKSGYISNNFNIIVQPGITDSQNGTLTPADSGESYRVVLTWGENPEDLDSHIEGLLSDKTPFHVYYSDMSQYDGDNMICNLDVDDVTSYGPETITLNPSANGQYYYYVYKYAGNGTVASSEARIRLYKGQELISSFNVPTNQGDGDYWNVFAIVNGKVVVKNTITDDADVGYASTRSSTDILNQIPDDEGTEKVSDEATGDMVEKPDENHEDASEATSNTEDISDENTEDISDENTEESTENSTKQIDVPLESENNNPENNEDETERITDSYDENETNIVTVEVPVPEEEQNNYSGETLDEEDSSTEAKEVDIP